MSAPDPSSLESIAVVGMSGRFPGARNVAEFWRNLVQGVDTISRFQEHELEYSVATKAAQAAGQKFVGARGVLQDVDLFDAAFFGIAPREAELMDPQHRLFLECAWETLESAGYDPGSYPGLIGVFAGLSLNTYLLNNLCRDRAFAADFAGNYQVGAYQLMMGNDKDFLPTRVSYKLNLRGPSMAVQSACSTSLVAISQACSSLLTFQCDMALAGGVSISFPQRRNYLYQEEAMVSADGTCRTFDAGAGGTVFSHGVAIVLLKRLSDAVAARDHVLAVIRGTAVNNDGASKIGYAAPSIHAQAEVIAMAHAAAGIDPEAISYVEAHGTGTPLGDPIEVAALTAAFRSGGALRNGFCALGTAKTHIGHLDVAAGATGLIKTVLQLQHGLIPPLLHFTAPNPKIDFARSPFFPIAAAIDWPRGAVPRRAGVSAFGVGGTNAHAVLEEAPLPEPSGPSRPTQLLLLSARSAPALAAMSANLALALETEPDLALADVAYTLALGRREFSHRRALLVRERADAVEQLRRGADAASATGTAPDRPGSVVFMFPGQGAQHVAMGRQLYRTEPVFRSAVDECAEGLEAQLGLDLRTTLYPDHGDIEAARARIQQTAYAQPLLFVVEYALARLWISWGIKPAALIGHSIGEYVCAVLADAVTLPEALDLLATRARLMQALPTGAMLAVRLDAAALAALLPNGVTIAAINSPKLCTVSGPADAVAAFQADLDRRKIATRALPTSHAFHSAMMDPMLAEFSAAEKRIAWRAPTLPWVSTCTGQWLTAADLSDTAYWSQQLRQPVRFSDALTTVLAEPNRILLEVGPGQALAQFVRQNPATPGGSTILGSLAANPEPSHDQGTTLATLGRLWVAGVRPDWNAYFAGEVRRRVPLPTYPFERKRFWIEAAPAASPTPEPASPAEPNSPTRSNTPTRAFPPIETTLARATPTESAPVDRLQRITLQVREALRELSGLEVSDDRATLVELGYDSLLLTQVSQELVRRFGVRVSFRQLNQDLATVEQLARHLDAPMPPDVPTAPAALPAVRVETPPAVTKPPPAVTFSTQAFGPSAVPARSSEPELTTRQREHLDGLIDRYTRRTGRSKALTQEYRAWHADPRTAAGFNRHWKEMCYPIVVASSQGARLRDVDGHEYIDLLNGFGPNFLGHSPTCVTQALREQLERGIEVGPQSPLAGETARLFCELTDNERASFVNTGSEAVYAAMRLARTVTGRDKIVTFARDYHGNFDEVLVRGLGAPTGHRSLPLAPGIPARAVQDMIVLDYGSDEALAYIEQHARDIAAVLVEPVQSRRPEFQPVAFLRALRGLTAATGVLLIFDEVITGLRDGPQGAQGLFGVKADLATYGKVVGGGMPIGVVAGKAQYMDTFDGGVWCYGDDSFPEKGVTFFAGTFVRHPMAIAAANAVLKFLQTQPPEFWQAINARAARLAGTVDAFFVERGAPIRMPHFCSQMFVRVQEDHKHGHLLAYHLREQGIFLLENFPCYLTAAHTDEDIDTVIAAFKAGTVALEDAGFLPAPQFVPGVALPAAVAPALPPPVPAPAPAPVASDANRFPLADGQREMWLGAQMNPEAAGPHHACTILELEGPLDVPALQRALTEVGRRHEGLRSVFSADGTEVIVRPDVDFPIPLDDLSRLAPEAARAQAAAIVDHESRRILDLAHGPLVACRLLRFSDCHHQLIFIAQMIVCDGWSHFVVFEELGTLYSAEAEGRPITLPPAPPMRAFALWQQRQREGAEAQACAAFWVSRFPDLPPPLELPAAPRPPGRTVAAARRDVVIDSALYQALKTLAHQRQSSPFALLLATFQTWLHRLSGARDLVVGVPFAAQSQLGLPLLVGQCANILPLRTRIDPEAPFTKLLKDTWDTVLDAQENWNYTFGQLALKLNVPRDPSRLPLVSVLFNLDPAMAKVRFAGLAHRVVSGPRHAFQYDLGFNLIEEARELRVECDFNTHLFDADNIRAWLDGFIALLRHIVTEPDQAIATLPMIPEPAMADDAGTPALESIPGEAQLGVHDLIEAQVRRTPDATAVVDTHGAFTYAQLGGRATRLAGKLQSLGIGPGATVGICLERNGDLVTAILGVLKTGAAYVPVAPDLPTPRLSDILHGAGVAAVVTHAALAPALPAGGWRTVALDTDEMTGAAADPFTPPGNADPDRLAYVIYTSGSTGQPKGVEIPQRAVVNFILAMQRDPGFTPRDAVLALSPVSFDISVLELLVPLTVGARTVIAPRSAATDPAALQELIANSGVTVVQATPSTWRMLLSSGWRGHPSLRLLSGGEAMTADLARQLRRCGAEVWNLYGPTETTVWSTARQMLADHDLSIGRPIRNTVIHLVDDFLQPVPVGVPGEILIGGAGLARGYRGGPELTAKKFIVDAQGRRFFRTGDRARRRADGGIEFLGRRDTQVKVRGCHVELGEVEAVLRQHPAVGNAVVALRPELPGGGGLVAYLTHAKSDHDAAAPRKEKELTRGVRQLARERLPDYMRPVRWLWVERLPRTPEGKLDRAGLPAPPDRVDDLAEDYMAPDSAVQQTLVRIWTEILAVQRIGIRDSFFDLGGQSLLAVAIFNRIERELGRKLPLSTLFRAPTIERLAAVLDDSDLVGTEWCSLVPIKPAGPEAPLFLIHGAGGNVLLYRALATHLSPDRPLYGLQSRGLDGRTPPLDTIAAMARAYLVEIRQVQPRGPYHLGGYCLGGTIAYEMAQQLRQAGEDVALVALLDTYNFSRALQPGALSLIAEKAKFHVLNLARLSPHNMWRYLEEKGRLARDGELASILKLQPKVGDAAGVARATSGAEALVQAVNDHAADTYLPQPYRGRLTLIKPHVNYKFYPDPELGWGDLAVGGLDIVEMQVNPHAMLVEPYVRQLAQELDRRMSAGSAMPPAGLDARAANPLVAAR